MGVLGALLERPVTILGFVAFAVCALLHIEFLSRLKNLLASRHPDIWATLKPQGVLGSPRAMRFAREYPPEAISDPELRRQVIRYRRLTLIGFAAFLAYGCGLIFRL